MLNLPLPATPAPIGRYIAAGRAVQRGGAGTCHTGPMATRRRSPQGQGGSAGSILSIGSSGSILSIGSAGSILSIGSAGSILSVGSVGSVAVPARRGLGGQRGLGALGPVPLVGPGLAVIRHGRTSAPRAYPFAAAVKTGR